MVFKTSPSLICRSGSRIGHKTTHLGSHYLHWDEDTEATFGLHQVIIHHAKEAKLPRAAVILREVEMKTWLQPVLVPQRSAMLWRNNVQKVTNLVKSKHHFFQHGITFQNSKAETKAIAEGGVLKMFPSYIEKVSLHVICMSLQDLKITWSWPSWFALVAWRWFLPPSDKRQPLRTWQSSTWHMFFYRYCFLCAFIHVHFISLSPRLPLSKMASHGTNQTSWTGNFGYVK